jgi:hypothetical protein
MNFAEFCSRHGITVTHEPLARGPRTYNAETVVGELRCNRMGYSAEEAVGDLLKALWFMETGVAPTITDGAMWMACAMRDGEPVDAYSYVSQFEAVAAVADRMVQQATTAAQEAPRDG